MTPGIPGVRRGLLHRARAVLFAFVRNWPVVAVLVGVSVPCATPAAQGSPESVLAAGRRVRIDTVGATGSFAARLHSLRGDTIWFQRDTFVSRCNAGVVTDLSRRRCSKHRVPTFVGVPPDRIGRLFVQSERSSRGHSARKGALFGGGVALIMFVSLVGTGGPCDDQCGSFYVVAGPSLAAAGALIGAVMGALSYDRPWIQIPWPPSPR
jgi:hypothetical protein